ncbi:hypothetical protein [Nostoc sp. 'Peltigera malacea cyanobiont' DB3992]|nr:hypothetical protein [Nostoc sp. 'Peltigera malacea cyanobiont' DB3992]
MILETAAIAIFSSTKVRSLNVSAKTTPNNLDNMEKIVQPRRQGYE